MMKIAWSACALAAALACGPAHAQRVTLAQALEAAWQRSTALHSTQARKDVAAAQLAAAKRWWASPPAVEIAHRTDRAHDDAGRTESEVGIAWPLLLPGQRAAQVAFAEAETRASETALRAERLALAGEVRQAAWAVIAAEAEENVAARHAADLKRLADDVERRIRAADLARADGLAARAEALAADAAASEARQRVQAARALWKALTGIDAVPDAPESEAAVADHPDLLRAALAVEAARRNLDLVRLTRRDPPELVLSYRREVPASGLPAEKSIAVGLKVPLGTSDRNAPREAAAAGELDVALAEERRRRDRLEAEATTARSALLAAERQRDAEAARASLLRERASLVERSFRAGETPLPDFLRAASAAAQAEAILETRRAAVGLARAQLNQTLGRLP